MNTTEIHNHALYIITRADLTPGQQIAQIAHATAKFCLEEPESARRWYGENEYMICLEVPDGQALNALCERIALETGREPSAYREPDMADAITAIALTPGATARRLTANLPLAGRAHLIKLATFEIMEDLAEFLPLMEMYGDTISIPIEGRGGVLMISISPKRYSFSYAPYHELGPVKPEERTGEVSFKYEGRTAECLEAWREHGAEFLRMLKPVPVHAS